MQIDPFNQKPITFLELAKVCNKTLKTVNSWKFDPENNPDGLPWFKDGSTSSTTQEAFTWWSTRDQRQSKEG